MNARTAPPYLRLGVNIDHVATIRNARGGKFHDPIRAAQMAVEGGADGITAHLREDRRHISDEDIDLLAAGVSGKPLNLEMAATEEMLAIALRHKPHAVCLVPERREERTTEGGLDAAGGHNHLAPVVRQLLAAKIRVSLFIEALPAQFQAAKALGANVVEIHTGAYCEAHAHEDFATRDRILERIKAGASEAARLGLEVHAGHGLTFDTVMPIAAVPQIVELNIGHFLVGEAIFIGLDASIRRMRQLMDQGRSNARAV
jgi:pyridoxine 5-phosphate synthase